MVSAVQESQAGYLVVLVTENRERDGEHGRHLARTTQLSSVHSIQLREAVLHLGCRERLEKSGTRPSTGVALLRNTVKQGRVQRSSPVVARLAGGERWHLTPDLLSPVDQLTVHS